MNTDNYYFIITDSMFPLFPFTHQPEFQPFPWVANSWDNYSLLRLTIWVDSWNSGLLFIGDRGYSWLRSGEWILPRTFPQWSSICYSVMDVRFRLYICSAMFFSLYTVGFRCKTSLELTTGPPSDGFWGQFFRINEAASSSVHDSPNVPQAWRGLWKKIQSH